MYVDPTGFEAAEEYAVTLPLTPGMLGLGEEVSITGELTVTSEGEATVTIESIAGKVPSPLKSLQSLISLALDNGGKELTILTSFAGQRLQDIAVNRFRFIDSAGQAIWYGVI
jgi:hypothetical protein